MCKVRVSVIVSNDVERSRALTKLGKFPGKNKPEYSKGVLSMLVEHPKDLSVLQAASWVKDVFGLDPTLCPSAKVMA
jgi:hypothetical protein